MQGKLHSKVHFGLNGYFVQAGTHTPLNSRHAEHSVTASGLSLAPATAAAAALAQKPGPCAALPRPLCSLHARQAHPALRPCCGLPAFGRLRRGREGRGIRFGSVLGMGRGEQLLAGQPAARGSACSGAGSSPHVWRPAAALTIGRQDGTHEQAPDRPDHGRLGGTIVQGTVQAQLGLAASDRHLRRGSNGLGDAGEPQCCMEASVPRRAGGCARCTADSWQCHGSAALHSR